jgi:hypothetical protein
LSKPVVIKNNLHSLLINRPEAADPRRTIGRKLVRWFRTSSDFSFAITSPGWPFYFRNRFRSAISIPSIRIVMDFDAFLEGRDAAGLADLRGEVRLGSGGGPVYL